MLGSIASLTAPLLFAQNAAGGGGGNQGSALLTFLPTIAIIIFWFYLFMVLPQRKQEKQRREMLSALKKNDKVVTAAGIYGTVVSVDDTEDRVLLRVDDDRGTRVAFTKASIVRVLNGKDVKESSAKDKAAETA
jgi:preprotein translocase subunit YajC